MIKGKGAQSNPENPFLKNNLAYEHMEGIDEEVRGTKPQTQLFFETPKNVISKVDSPDLGFYYSINPYQGCEHGCVYCYARNSHTYWGFSAGLDFETKIIVKKDVAAKLEERLMHPKWDVQPIMLSGNTDCYQPIEKELGLTRSLLNVFLKFRHPVSIITKNTLILRDKDLLAELASLSLVYVHFSITSLDESLRQLLEPRTATYQKKLEAIRELTDLGVPVGVMNAPIIPGLNVDSIPKVVKATAEAGSLSIGYTVVRLNGQIGEIFKEWIEQTYPDRAQKVLNQISEMHNGKLNDSEWGRRITGDGSYATLIHDLFEKARNLHYKERKMPPLRMDLFRRGGHYTLF